MAIGDLRLSLSSVSSLSKDNAMMEASRLALVDSALADWLNSSSSSLRMSVSFTSSWSSYISRSNCSSTQRSVSPANSGCCSCFSGSLSCCSSFESGSCVEAMSWSGSTSKQLQFHCQSSSSHHPLPAHTSILLDSELGEWRPSLALPALFMAGRAPFRAQRRFPPKGTYCWLRGKLSVLRSCRRCFSLKIEWTVFRKSFLLSGELKGIEEHWSSSGQILTYSTAERSSLAFPQTQTLCGQSHTWKSPPHLRKTEPGHVFPTYLFLFTTLLSDKQIEHSSKLLMDLLHLVDMAGNFVHGFHGNCRQTENNMIWNQSGPVFQGLEKLNLKLHHFRQVSKQNIQLEEKASKMSVTYFDIGAFGLHEFTDDFAEFVGIRELSLSCRRWEGRVRARRRGHTLRGIHVMETAAESGDLLRTLQKKDRSVEEKLLLPV
ncbi:hypothetical protein F7725_020494, partial [Dissostichus mawsoni]